MKVENALAMFFKYSGFVMAAVFASAIVSGLAGFGSSKWLSQLGILIAIIIPISGLVLTMIILFRNHEKSSAFIAIGLLIALALTVAWRLSS